MIMTAVPVSMVKLKDVENLIPPACLASPNSLQQFLLRFFVALLARFSAGPRAINTIYITADLREKISASRAVKLDTREMFASWHGRTSCP